MDSSPQRPIMLLTTIKNGMKEEKTHYSQNSNTLQLNSSTLILTAQLDLIKLVMSNQVLQ